MTKNLLVLIGITLVVGLLSILITTLRAERMSPPADLAPRAWRPSEEATLPSSAS